MAGLNMSLITKKLTAATAAVKKAERAEYLRGTAIKAYKEAVKEIPQWSGHMASNLTISVDGKESTGTDKYYNPNWREQHPRYEKGKDPAVATANERNRWVNECSIDINSKISIHYAPTAADRYFSTVEKGIGTRFDLRQVNLPSRALTKAAMTIPRSLKVVWARAGWDKHRI